MWLKQFYLKDNSKTKKFSNKKKYNILINYMRKKSVNYQMRRNYSTKKDILVHFLERKKKKNIKKINKKELILFIK